MERVFNNIKLEKYVKCQFALGRGEGIGIGIGLQRKVIEKVIYRCIEETSMVESLVEKEIQTRSMLTMFKVGCNKISKRVVVNR